MTSRRWLDAFFLCALAVGSDACQCGGGKTTDQSNGDVVDDNMVDDNHDDLGTGMGSITQAKAGDDRRACVAEAVTLGTAAQPGLTYSWTPAAGLSDPASAQPTFQPTAAGTYVFTLHVTDATGRNADTTVTITVPTPPAAVIAADTLATCAGGSVDFDGAQSSSAASYSWDFDGDGQADAANANPAAHAYSNAGSYQVKLTVTDDNGCSASTTTTVTVCPAFPTVSFTSAAQSVGEGAGTATVAVVLDAASSVDVTVPLALSGTAATPGDYSVAQPTLTIPAGGITASAVVSLVSDGLDEADETVVVTMGTLINANGGGTHTLTITDDDGPPAISVSDLFVSEGVDAVFTVNLSRPSALPVSVAYTTVSGTAGALDFDTTSGTLPFAPGSTGMTVSVHLDDDSLNEGLETFFFQLSAPSGGVAGNMLAQATIIDNDGPPSLWVFDAFTGEGAGGLRVDVVLSGFTLDTVDVAFATTGDTATADVDFTTTAGALSFASGEVHKTITVPVVSDSDSESVEQLFVELSNAGTTTIADGHAVLTIVDDDGTPAWWLRNASAVEGAGFVRFPLLLTGEHSAVSVTYLSHDGTASGGADYTGVSGSVSFASTDFMQLVAVPITGDALDEDDESFSLSLSNDGSIAITAPTGIALIEDDDALPVLSIVSRALNENAGGVQYEVILQPQSGRTVQVVVNSADGSATIADGDYDDVGAVQLIFAPGVTGQSFNVTIHDDSQDETNESFTLGLTGASNATVGQASANVTILDDDGAPALSIDSVSANEGDGAITFNVHLLPASGQQVQVTFATQDGSATSGDYGPTGGVLTFAPGVTGQTIHVTLADDAFDELNETFEMLLTAPTNATIDAPTGIATVIDNDDTPLVSIDDATIDEGTSPSSMQAKFVVRLSAASALDVHALFSTVSGGSADELDDYAGGTQLVTIPAGAVTGAVFVAIVPDAYDEPNETFFVTLSGPTNAQLDDWQAQATISDDDDPPVLSISGASILEGSGAGGTTGSFLVTLSQRSERLITVQWSTSGDGALAGSDFTQVSSGTLVFPAGVTGRFADVSIVRDALDEDDLERFFVTLDGANNASLPAITQVAGFIEDDDATPSVGFVSSTSAPSEGASAQLVVQLDAISGRNVTVSFARDSSSSASSDDYTLTASPVTIPAGTGSTTLTLAITNDLVVEGSETLLLTITGASNANISQATHTATIGDDDQSPLLTSAETLDADANGHIDRYRLTFSKAMQDATFQAGAWAVSGYSGITLVTGVTGDVANDAVLYVAFDELGMSDTDATPQVTMGATGLLDFAGNALAVVTAASVSETDKAPPILISATTETTSSELLLTFSEPVQTAANPTCSGTLNVATDFVYTDAVAPTTVTGVTGGTDSNGCDQAITVRAISGAFSANDVFRDKIAPAAGEIFDTAGNTAPAVQVTLSGIVHPYVLDVVSQGLTKVRISYSEGVTNAAAIDTSNYTLTAPTGCDAGAALVGPTGTKVSDDVYTFATTTQQGCTYTLAVKASAPITDLNDGVGLVTPMFGTFLGNEQLKVVSAEAVSARSFDVVFSKDVAIGPSGGSGAETPSYYAIPSVLGTVTSAVRHASQHNRVRVTHTQDQGALLYTVIVDGAVRVDGETETLAGNPRDRTTFLGFGAATKEITSPNDGPLFSDPFGDGTTFSFTFKYGDKIFVGPNDTNAGVFRFDIDGKNPRLRTFSTKSNKPAGTYESFGSNLKRPVTSVSVSGTATTYSVTKTTNLSPFFPAASGVTVNVTGCTVNAANNKTLSGSAGAPGSGAAIIIDDAADTVTINTGIAGVAFTGDSCSLQIYRAGGPAGFTGVDAFVSAIVGGLEYLVYGGHLDYNNNFAEIQFTRDTDSQLDNDYCNIGDGTTKVTLGNTQSLQTIYGAGNYVYIGFASNQADKPVLAYHDFSVVSSGDTPCGGLSDLVADSGTKKARAIPGIGGNGGNTAGSIGIDSIIVFNDAGTNRLLVANNGGIAQTTTIPPNQATWTNLMGAAPAGGTGTTAAIPNIGELRPGEKGIPFMIDWNGYLIVARNRGDIANAELWKYRNGSWSKLIGTDSSTGNMNTDNTRISMVIINGARLYVGFDNPNDGAELWRTKTGVTAASVSSVSDFEQVASTGLGPATAPTGDRQKNKYFISSTSANTNGKDYLYMTVGCNSDYSNNGSCDRDASGETDFAIRLFLQVD